MGAGALLWVRGSSLGTVCVRAMKRMLQGWAWGTRCFPIPQDTPRF